jgi:hypothetical protein
MSAGKHKFEIEQGATFNPILTWKDENDTVINLTDFTARMQIRQSVNSSTVLEELTTENGGITLGGVLGTITLLISASDTAAYTWKTGVYDLELISPTGIVTRLLQGTVIVSPEVTR